MIKKYMLSEKQKEWIDHLSDEDKIKIIPFDSSSEGKFKRVKKTIQSKMGELVEVKHCGATSLGISGQDEIDVYVPVLPGNFDSFLELLTELFDEPRSHYSLERARFVTLIEGKHVDIFLINKESDGWLNALKFEQYLRGNIAVLEEYRELKESGQGLSVREYYKRKIEFINEILQKNKIGKLKQKLQQKGNEITCPVAVIVRDNKILMGLRNYTPDKWKTISVWTLPGGRSDKGETLEETLRRETKEETGIDDLKILEFVGEFSGSKEGDKVPVFLCESKQEAELIEPHKFSGWEWFEKKDFPENFINKDIRPIILGLLDI